MSTEESKNDFIYDIAFSFAGEKRDYVNKLYEILKNEYDVKVFYDLDIETQIDSWGKHLGEHFQQVYEKQSRWCLIFISKEYKEKAYTRHELRSALSRAIEQKDTYLLPARFDDTEIEGIPSSIGYIDISNKTPNDFSEFVIGKLGIQSKKRSKNLSDSNNPNIKISTYVGFLVADMGLGQLKQLNPLVIEISNHDKSPVFLKYPKIPLKNSIEHIALVYDDVYEKHIYEIGKLEPGNSVTIYCNLYKYAHVVNKLDNVIIEDKIGRTFKGNPYELSKAIGNWIKLNTGNVT